MNVAAKRFLAVTLAVVALGACTVDKAAVPDMVGPSGLGLSIDVTASPDVLVRDAESQSVIEVTVRDGNGPVANATVVVTASPNLGTLKNNFLTTNASGKASTIYTAPGFGGTTTATITVTPSGSNFQNALTRTITIRLFQPAS